MPVAGHALADSLAVGHVDCGERCQSSEVSDSRPNSARPVEYVTRGCTAMCWVMTCTSRNARSSGQLTYIELPPPATYTDQQPAWRCWPHETWPVE